jgi:hypothetical protein
MNFGYRAFLIVFVLLACLAGPGSAANTNVDGSLFDPLPRMSRAELDAHFIFASDSLGFSLLEPLYHDRRCDCYTLTVSTRETSTLQVVHLWRAPRGFYRTANGPYLELEEVDSLKAVTALNGTRLLFAEVGDGEWRCVSIHESSGNYLLIDYRADGLIERLRDSRSRSVIPTYSNGRVVSVTQTWTTTAGTRTQTTLISN